METAVVVPVGAGRKENVMMMLDSLRKQTIKPRLIVMVCDGEDAWLKIDGTFDVPLACLHTPKHKPGMNQPRNIGVQLVSDMAEKDERFAGITHVWFVDTDIIFDADCLEHYQVAMDLNPTPRILVGPYDWLPKGHREPVPSLYNDDRWASFNDAKPTEERREDLAAGLACFSGNLVWPIEEFKRVGGFWDELHHGRCEDGELGLRAVGMGVPISLVKEARGWHLWHPRNEAWIKGVNSRDVPKINERHPWKEIDAGEELFVVDEDGARFNWRCPNCKQEMNSAEIFRHKAGCHE